MVTVIGMGPGDGRYALPGAMEAVNRCSVLAGYPRQLDRCAAPHHHRVNLSRESGEGLEKGLSQIDLLRTDHHIGIVVSGDPGFHSLLKVVLRMYPVWDPLVVPGVTAFQVACARLRLPWQDYELFSFHGKQAATFDRSVRAGFPSGTIILTGDNNTPGAVAAQVVSLNPECGRRTVWLCHDVGEDKEFFEASPLEDVHLKKAGRLSTMIIP